MTVRNSHALNQGTVVMQPGDSFYCHRSFPHADTFEGNGEDGIEVLIASHDRHLALVYL